MSQPTSPAIEVVPYLYVDGAARAIDFYKRAFGARETYARITDGSGRVGHAELAIGKSTIMSKIDISSGAAGVAGGSLAEPSSLGASSSIRTRAGKSSRISSACWGWVATYSSSDGRSPARYASARLNAHIVQELAKMPTAAED